MSGSAFATNLWVTADAFTVNSGQPAQYAKITDKENTMTSYFCRDCGTTLWQESTGLPGTKLVKEGALVELSQKKPDIEYYTERRATWLEKIDGAEQKKVG